MNTTLPEITDATRREFIALLGAAGLLTACGSDDDSADGPAGPGFPRDVAHELGTTRIDARPERVAAISDGAELASLLALGITPVGFGQRQDPLTPWTAEAGGDDPAIPRYPLDVDINIEVVATWAPDLIVGQIGLLDTTNIGTIDRIAPTVATQPVNWRVNLDQVARATGTEDRAAELAASLDREIATVGERLARLAPLRITWLFPFDDGSVSEYHANSMAGLLVADLGLRPLSSPPGQEPGQGVTDNTRIAAERLGDIDADVIVLIDGNESGTARGFAEANPLWAALPAVVAGRVIEMSKTESEAFNIGSVLSVPVALDAIDRRFAMIPA